MNFMQVKCSRKFVTANRKPTLKQQISIRPFLLLQNKLRQSKRLYILLIAAASCGFTGACFALHDNPEMSLRELGEQPEPISRSGINHRLKRIMAFAETVGKRTRMIYFNIL